MTIRRTTGMVAAAALAVGAAGAVALAADAPVDLVDASATAPVLANRSFVDPLAERFGRLEIGQRVFVAGNTVVRADPGRRVCIAGRSNVQDNASLLALAGEPARGGTCALRATEVGERTTVAHRAQVVNSRVGDFAFVGFGARVENAVVEDGAFILHGALVRNVRVPRNRVVGIGRQVTRQAAANALPRKEDALAAFQDDVLEVNEALAAGYAGLFRRGGFESVVGISRAPLTAFNRGARPLVGRGLQREPFAQIVGGVRIARNARVGRRSSIRADEGAPIVIGPNAAIGDRVTLHALRGSTLTVGERLRVGDDAVLHGPLAAGDDLTIGDDAILFRAAAGDRVTIGAGAIVVGPVDDPIELRDGVSVPPGAIVTTQALADALP